MRITMLKGKIHRATVTDADLSYEGSISIDPGLCAAAGLRAFERVDIYNCNNGARFSTYIIHGGPGEICLNGAAARHVDDVPARERRRIAELRRRHLVAHRAGHRVKMRFGVREPFLVRCQDL